MSALLPSAALVAGGGNPGLGTAAGSGGFGDLTITLRGTYTKAVLPETGYAGVTDTVRAARVWQMTLPRVDLRLGLLRKELPMGAASVDLLGSVIPIPRTATTAVRFGPQVRSLGDFALGFGYGIRIAMAPTGPMPVVSLNVSRTGLPEFSFGDVSQGSTYAYSLSVAAINARLLIGKRFGGIELTGGAGVDLLSGRYSVVYTNPDDASVFPRADSTLSGMRILTLANAAWLLGPARLTLEGGFQVGKDDKLTTIFEANDTRAGRFFGGLGIGFKL
jgi:hypothetical protein